MAPSSFRINQTGRSLLRRLKQSPSSLLSSTNPRLLLSFSNFTVPLFFVIVSSLVLTPTYQTGDVVRFGLLTGTASWLALTLGLSVALVWLRRVGRDGRGDGNGHGDIGSRDRGTTTTTARIYAVVAAAFWVMGAICERTALEPTMALWPASFLPAAISVLYLFERSIKDDHSRHGQLTDGRSIKGGSIGTTTTTTTYSHTSSKSSAALNPPSSSISAYRYPLLALFTATATLILSQKFALASSVVFGCCNVAFLVGSLVFLWSGYRSVLKDATDTGLPPLETVIVFQRDFAVLVGIGSVGLSLLMESWPLLGSLGYTEHRQIKFYAFFGVLSVLKHLLMLVSLRYHGPIGMSFLFVIPSLITSTMMQPSPWTISLSLISLLSATLFCQSTPWSRFSNRPGLPHTTTTPSTRSRQSKTVWMVLTCCIFVSIFATFIPGRFHSLSSTTTTHIASPFQLHTNTDTPFGPMKLPTTSVHPVEQLMQNAKLTFEATKLRQSKTLAEAVIEYRARYHIPPPPHFDRWFQFAVSNGYVMVDEFDSIFHNLQPFWAIDPALVRRRAIDGISDSRNSLKGVHIRNGQVISPSPSPSTEGDDNEDEWLRKSVIGMMAGFVQFLPDMDLAFNIHDEPRVVIQHERLAKIVHQAQERGLARSRALEHPENSFSSRPTDLTEKGGSITPSRPTEFNQFAHQNSWSHSRQSCPPNSQSQSIDQDPSFTPPDNKTAYSISSLEFIYNQTGLEDICNSPSLGSTHGFFDRPNAFNVVQNLFPIFSQSKISSFQDVLYPSPWYWAEKVGYDKDADDVEWEGKAKSLYWRGSTTGGYSDDGAWRRHHRQRAVMKINGLDEFSQANPQGNVFVLEDVGGGGSSSGDDTGSSASNWQAHNTSLSSQSSNFDVRFSHVGQCSVADCQSQSKFFSVGDTVTRSEAFKSKLVLDLDGNAFSGRFYAFMKSASLVIKQSIFQEWHSGGTILVPWVHYIPFSFTGLEWVEVVRYLIFDGTGKERAREMAVRQREWADLALRKVDLEVYFFRLLLEYGRVVDDRRELIGYAGP